jgi:hypothetical protein
MFDTGFLQLRLEQHLQHADIGTVRTHVWDSGTVFFMNQQPKPAAEQHGLFTLSATINLLLFSRAR